MTSNPSTPAAISRRGASLIPSHSQNRVSSAIACAFNNVYSVENPEGLVSLGVAENWTMQDWLVEYFRRTFEIETEDLHYQSLHGPNPFKSSLCRVFNQYFIPFVPLKQDHLVTGIGATCVLEQLLYTLCDEGDHIIIAKPYYPGFDRVTTQRLNITITGVNVPKEVDPSSEGVLNCFESVYQQLEKPGLQHKVKCIILCNPNNPLGFIYSKEVLIQYMRFCEKHNLHLIVDEVYAFSVFDPRKSSSSLNDPESIQTTEITKTHHFSSALSIDCQKEAGCDPRRLHVGEAGVLISQHNSTVIDSVRSTALQMQIPRPTEILLEKFLGDSLTLDWYIKEYVWKTRADRFYLYFILFFKKKQAKLQIAYEYAVERLKTLGIAYLESCAGHFVVIDLQRLLPSHGTDGKPLETPWEKEEALFLRLLNECNLYLVSQFEIVILLFPAKS
ncbi:hypothetical protein CROQUDRAFT_44479 [Cronartium quercuum f. sp. fusiforme G11]|uniref:Aminotransferase class I/classII large domain-containing protein n=1 Tax=Cronartium quercuum f. sp. fusiforme G11 TaxID=708437 RepID=A0A9P6TD81_9BASI|nr:hypothetical protein CROQUDRAFT_44479 [Cronartium quercuum f. sp. fusiforme G11]